MLIKCDLCFSISNVSFRLVCCTSKLFFVATSTFESIVCSLRYDIF